MNQKKEVYMEAIVRIPSAMVLDKTEIAGIDFGGYTFEIAGMSVRFDFEGYSVNVEEDENGQHLYMHTAESGFSRNTDIDTESYADDYKNLSLNCADITASFLASATKIEEFFFRVEMNDGTDKGDGFILESIIFIDEHGTEHAVAPELLGNTISTYQN